MNILNKISIKNLKLNKKRTIGTIIGIILSVALICAVAGMATCARQTLINNAVNETGYYHLKLSDIDKKMSDKLSNNRDIKDIKKIYNLGYSYFNYDEGCKEKYLEVLSINKNGFNDLAYALLEGELPKNENEIVISNKVSKNSNLKLGDTITLEVGKRITTDGYELDNGNPETEDETIINKSNMTFKIVGIVNKKKVDNNYYAITTNRKSDEIISFISLKNPGDYKKSVTDILDFNNYTEVEKHSRNDISYDYELNHELLRWEVFAFSDNTISMLLSTIAIVILVIIIVSVFCIRNSFAISTTEKIKMYGMLSSVGATKKQIKKSVLFEGFILGLIGIPVGILSGVLAVYILIIVINLIFAGKVFDTDIAFSISFIPILISIILGYVTIYFSAISSAKKASKVSPIEQLRSSEQIKINPKKLKTPKVIQKIFKTGGVLAYKNLKRSKKKYKTTVISLTISIFAFITMSTFLSESFKLVDKTFEVYDYNLSIKGDIKENQVDEIKKLKTVDRYSAIYEGDSYLKFFDKTKMNNIPSTSLNKDCFYDETTNKETCGEEYLGINLISMDHESFKKYVQSLNLSYDEVKEDGILCDNYLYYGSGKTKELRRYKFNKDDVITGYYKDKKIDIRLAKVSDNDINGTTLPYYHGGYLVIDKDYHKDITFTTYNLLVQAKDTDRAIKDIDAINNELYIRNLDEDLYSQKAINLVISIFLYGFITVITLIGITNIFNTITANMELRQKEFAMLKSIGMTKKEFNRMINLETIFYSGKSLFYGIILGIIGSFVMHKALGEEAIIKYEFPVKEIIISIIFVFLLVYLIMKYSINKINKQNIIETIRKENI